MKTPYILRASRVSACIMAVCGVVMLAAALLVGEVVLKLIAKLLLTLTL